ncbi:hypothetical protein ABGF48_03090 [Helcococcus bovis]
MIKKTYKLSNEGHIEVDPHFWFNIELYKTAFKEFKNYLIELIPEKKVV